jgi:hypothetical protein
MGALLIIFLWLGGIFISDKIAERKKNAKRAQSAKSAHHAHMRVIKGCRQSEHLKKSA